MEGEKSEQGDREFRQKFIWERKQEVRSRDSEYITHICTAG